ncbi:hypothetical protein EAI_01796 [Harpegnathos saltator]|uniref:SAP domain-containing protein n=1 Tax=Harpegnathos saltator TaxID=610380 RepID=E2BBU2_HARSA|nr:hypothetical protein EAI_01796 [Harpegnathos saltator]
MLGAKSRGAQTPESAARGWIDALTVEQLRVECEKRGLSTLGILPVLRDRLHRHELAAAEALDPPLGQQLKEWRRFRGAAGHGGGTAQGSLGDPASLGRMSEVISMRKPEGFGLFGSRSPSEQASERTSERAIERKTERTVKATHRTWSRARRRKLQRKLSMFSTHLAK